MSGFKSIVDIIKKAKYRIVFINLQSYYTVFIIKKNPNISKKHWKVLLLREPENEALWDRSKSIGMSFVNSIISEEDAQFELYGHYKIWWSLQGIWSTYYYKNALVRKAVKGYIKQSQKGSGPFNLCHRTRVSARLKFVQQKKTFIGATQYSMQQFSHY